MPYLKVTVQGGFEQEVELAPTSTLTVSAGDAVLGAWAQVEAVEVTDEPTLEPDDKPRERMTKAELADLADNYGIDVPAGASKAEIEKLLADAEK